MAAKKVTVTLDETQLDRIRALVEALMPGVTLDAGALIALERDDGQVLVLLAQARETGAHLMVPATALAQVVRAPARLVRLARLVRQRPPMSFPWAGSTQRASTGFSASGTTDIVDAHVAICARRAAQQGATSDPDVLRVLDPDLRVVRM
jgi:hypothetical protein